jgi:hypothetical protein
MRDIVPTVLDPEDPCAQDETLPVSIPHPSPEKMLFLKNSLAALQGYPESLSLETLASKLQLTAPIKAPPLPPVLPCLVSDAILANLAEDYHADLGVLYERVSGNLAHAEGRVWAEETIFERLASVLFFVQSGGARPVDIWLEEAGGGPLKKPIRMLDHAVPFLYQGQTPLEIGTPKTLDGCWIGRLYQVEDQFHTAGAFVLPPGLPLLHIWKALRLRLWRYRLQHPGAALTELLRLQPLSLYRATLETLCFYQYPLLLPA